MDPKTKVRIDLIGQWAEDKQEFSADIYEYFGYGVKRFHGEMQNGSVTFMRIESTEPVFELPEIEDIVKPRIHSIDGKPFERMLAEEDTFMNDNETYSDDIADLEGLFEDDIMSVDGLRDGTDRENNSSSGLYAWFIISLFIVGGILLAVVYGVARNYGAREERQKYKFTGI